MDKEGVSTVKKTRDIAFLIVSDPLVKKDLINLTNCPSDATNFAFWYSKIVPDEWGLTVRAIESTSKSKSSSQHNWKLSWFYKNGEMLLTDDSSRAIGSDIPDKNVDSIFEKFKLYKK